MHGHNAIFHDHKVARGESLNQTLHILFDDGNLDEGTNELQIQLHLFVKKPVKSCMHLQE